MLLGVVLYGGGEGEWRREARTRLEDEGATHIDISAIAFRLDSLICAYQRADDEGGPFADGIEGSKGEGHGRSRRGLDALGAEEWFVSVVGAVARSSC